MHQSVKLLENVYYLEGLTIKINNKSEVSYSFQDMKKFGIPNF